MRLLAGFLQISSFFLPAKPRAISWLSSQARGRHDHYLLASQTLQTVAKTTRRVVCPLKSSLIALVKLVDRALRTRRVHGSLRGRSRWIAACWRQMVGSTEVVLVVAEAPHFQGRPDPRQASRRGRIRQSQSSGTAMFMPPPPGSNGMGCWSSTWRAGSRPSSGPRLSSPS